MSVGVKAEKAKAPIAIDLILFVYNKVYGFSNATNFLCHLLNNIASLYIYTLIKLFSLTKDFILSENHN